MKLLLTSAGFTNNTIVQALRDLVQKPLNELRVVYIPTASNVEEGDKWWVIDEMRKTHKLGWEFFDIVDFSAVSRSIWLARLRTADVLVFGGGSTYHLMASMESSGMKEVFERVLEDKVYVGISAGSMIATKNVQFGWDQEFYGITTPLISGPGLGFINFHIMPHLHLSAFPKVTEKNIAKLADKARSTVYAIDNDTAIVVDHTNISVVSEGVWKKFN